MRFSASMKAMSEPLKYLTEGAVLIPRHVEKIPEEIISITFMFSGWKNSLLVPNKSKSRQHSFLLGLKFKWEATEAWRDSQIECLWIDRIEFKCNFLLA